MRESERDMETTEFGKAVWAACLVAAYRRGHSRGISDASDGYWNYAPLSGEWAGESVPELLGDLIPDMDPNNEDNVDAMSDLMAEYERGYDDGHEQGDPTGEIRGRWNW